MIGTGFDRPQVALSELLLVILTSNPLIACRRIWCVDSGADDGAATQRRVERGGVPRGVSRYVLSTRERLRAWTVVARESGPARDRARDPVRELVLSPL